MKERMFRKARISFAATVVFAACPGDDIAMFTAVLAPAIDTNLHIDEPHQAVLDQKKIEMKLPPMRISRLPKR